MTERTQAERKRLGRVLLGSSAVTSVLAIVYLIRFIFFDNDANGFIAAVAFAVTMLYGALMGVGMNYTIRVQRGKDEDRSQILAGMVMALLGTAICVSMQILLGIGDYQILALVYYAQTAIILVVGVLTLKFYRR